MEVLATARTHQSGGKGQKGLYVNTAANGCSSEFDLRSKIVPNFRKSAGGKIAWFLGGKWVFRDTAGVSYLLICSRIAIMTLRESGNSLVHGSYRHV